jgi:hypothetical protein
LRFLSVNGMARSYGYDCADTRRSHVST